MWDKALAVYDDAGMLRIAGQVRSNVGVFLTDRTRYDEAAAVLRRAIDDLTAAEGAGHPAVADACFNLARVQGQLGHSTEALALAKAALGTYVATRGRASDDAFAARQTAAAAMAKLGQPEDVIAMYQPEFRRLADDELTRAMFYGLVQQVLAHQALGQRREAAALWRRAEALAEAQGMQERLAEERADVGDLGDG